MERTVNFIDKNNKLAIIHVEDVNGYLSMTGDYNGGLGQVVDRINPATDAQKKLVEFWNTYHLEEDFPAGEIESILDKLDEEFAHRGKGSEFDINEDNQDMFDVIAEVFDCDDTRAKAIVAVARHAGMTFDDIINGVELYDDEVEFYGIEYLSLTDSEADSKAREYVKYSVDDLTKENRGNILSTYDGVEYEEDVDGETFYIYRQ